MMQTIIFYQKPYYHEKSCNFSKFFQIFPNFSKFFQIFLLLVVSSGFLRAQVAGPCNGHVTLEAETFDPVTNTIKVNVMARMNVLSLPQIISVDFTDFQCFAQSIASTSSTNNLYMQMSNGLNVSASNQPTTIIPGQFKCTLPTLLLPGNGNSVKVGTVILNVGGACGSSLNFLISSCTAKSGGTLCYFEIDVPGPPGSGLTVYAPKCPVFPTISGQVKKPVDACPSGGTFTQGFKDVDIQVSGSSVTCPVTKTNPSGFYTSCELPANNTYSVKASKCDVPNHTKGQDFCLSVSDIVMMRKTLLNEAGGATQPWQFIACDFSGNGTASTFDIVELRKYILSYALSPTTSLCYKIIPEVIYNTLPANNTALSLVSPITPSLVVSLGTTNIQQADFIGIVPGDVNGNCYCNEILNTPYPSDGDVVVSKSIIKTDTKDLIDVIYDFPHLKSLEMIAFDVNLPSDVEVITVNSNLPNFNQDAHTYDAFNRLEKIIWLNLEKEKVDKAYIRLSCVKKNAQEITKSDFNITGETYVDSSDGDTYSIVTKDSEILERNTKDVRIYSNDEFAIYDIYGRIVSSAKDINSIQEFKRTLENGIYILLKSTNGIPKTTKFVIQN